MGRFKFEDATKDRGFARVAFYGPPGSGKTYSALATARGLVGPKGRIGLIDTENKTSKKFGKRFKFQCTLLNARTGYSPDTYVEAIEDAEAQGYDCLIVDGLSPAWEGLGGALQTVDEIATRSKSGNTFIAWGKVTPMHDRLIEKLKSVNTHLIVTMRAKMEYLPTEVERNGRKVMEPRMVGMRPIQRDTVLYELDVVVLMDMEHTGIVQKSRCEDLDSKVIDRPGAALGETLRNWLMDGEEPQPEPAPPPPREAAPSNGAGRLVDPAPRPDRARREPEPPPAEPRTAALPAGCHDGSYVVPVGEHKDKPIRLVPASGLFSMMRAAKAPATLKLAAEAELARRERAAAEAEAAVAAQVPAAVAPPADGEEEYDDGEGDDGDDQQAAPPEPAAEPARKATKRATRTERPAAAAQSGAGDDGDATAPAA